MTDKEIIQSIKAGGSQGERTVSYLIHTNKGIFIKIKQKHGLSDEAMKDLYADTISQLVWNIKTGTFKGNSKLSTYIYQIFYNKSVDHIRHTSTNKNKSTYELTEEAFQHDRSVEDQIILRQDVKKVKSLILALGNPCSGIILDWAYWGYSMKEIAERNQLENASKAKRRKYNCLQKLREKLDALNL